MRQFWNVLYRDRFSRTFFAAGLVFFVGDFLLGIWPEQHPHYSLRDWLLFACTYWAVWLVAGSIWAGFRSIAFGTRKISVDRH